MVVFVFEKPTERMASEMVARVLTAHGLPLRSGGPPLRTCHISSRMGS
jgi:hypothetical protein